MESNNNNNHLNAKTLQKMHQENLRFDIESKNDLVKTHKAFVEAIDSLPTTLMSPEEIERAERQIERRQTEFATPKLFISPHLTAMVEPRAGDLIGIGGVTNAGKSYVAANIALSNALAGHKTLILSLEESREDTFQRVACLKATVSYADMKKIDEPGTSREVKERVRVARAELYPLVQVVTDPALTTLDGMTDYLKRLVNEGEHWDGLVIDYFSVVNTSTKYPGWDSTKVLGRFCDILNQIKDELKYPIYILLQLHPHSKDRNDFESRIKDRKQIVTKCTTALEIVANKETKITEWVLQKKRHGDLPCKTSTDFVHGRHVDRGNFFIKVS